MNAVSVLKIPPHSIEAERSVIGSVMINPSCLQSLILAFGLFAFSLQAAELSENSTSDWIPFEMEPRSFKMLADRAKTEGPIVLGLTFTPYRSQGKLIEATE